MKALSGLNSSSIDSIIKKRPYAGIKDFMMRCPLNKTQMISLIKAGAFDELEKDWAKELGIEARYIVMVYYLSKICDFKKRLTLQNFNGLIQKDLIPESLNDQKQVFLLNKKLKGQKHGEYYLLDENDTKYYEEVYDIDKLNIVGNVSCIHQKDWDKIYQSEMDAARDWLKENQDEMLKKLNELIFLEEWDKYASGSLSAWEMDSMCFYYHDHELANADLEKYGISSFFDLPEDPEVDYFFKRNNQRIPIYKLTRIIGTVIGKNDTRSSIFLLTTQGVVSVKFTKEYYAMYNRQISEVQDDGRKKIMEKSWFTRGTKVMCTGFRRDDIFVTKKYSNTPTHQLYKITNIDNKGQLTLIHERYGQENEN